MYANLVVFHHDYFTYVFRLSVKNLPQVPQSLFPLNQKNGRTRHKQKYLPIGRNCFLCSVSIIPTLCRWSEGKMTQHPTIGHLTGRYCYSIVINCGPTELDSCSMELGNYSAPFCCPDTRLAKPSQFQTSFGLYTRRKMNFDNDSLWIA